MPTPLRFSWPCVALLLGGALPTQEPAPSPAPDARLQQLLRELRTTDAAAWTARLQQLERDAKAQDAEAAKLREQATALQQRADAATAAAKAIRAESAKLQELQLLLQALPAPAPAPAQPAAPATPPPAAPAPAPPSPTKTMPAAPTSAAKEPRAAAASKDDAAPVAVVAWPQVAAIFTASCTGCHEPGEQKGGLDLSTFRGTLTGGGSGQSVVPGEPGQSRLWRMVAQEERPFMPRNADPLAKGELATIRTWIEQGAAETPEAARAFVAERAKRANAAAAPGSAAETAPPSTTVLPTDVPSLPVQRAARAAPIASLVRSPTAPLLAVPGVQQVLLLDGDGQLAAVLPSPLPQLGPLAFAEDGSTLLVTGGERGRRGVGVVHDVRTGAVLATVGDERDVPLAAALHQRAGLVALGGAGKHARVHRLRDGGLAMAGKHADFVLALAFAPDAGWLAAADRAGGVTVWETATGRVFQQLVGHQGAVHAVAFDRSGKSLLTAGADGTLRLWDVAAAKERWRQNAHPNQQALACAFGPGDVLASAGSDGVIATFSSAGKPGAKSKPAGEWLYALAFGSDGDHVFAGDWLGRLHCFDVAKKALTVVAPPTAAE